MDDGSPVRVSAGSLRDDAPTYVLPHGWTDAGIAVDGLGTGAHLLHTAVAVCVLNDVLREAERDGLSVTGVAVAASGRFDEDWRSTGVVYAVELESPEDDGLLAGLLARVDEVAEIPRAVRAGAEVRRDG